MSLRPCLAPHRAPRAARASGHPRVSGNVGLDVASGAVKGKRGRVPTRTFTNTNFSPISEPGYRSLNRSARLCALTTPKRGYKPVRSAGAKLHVDGRHGTGDRYPFRFGGNGPPLRNIQPRCRAVLARTDTRRGPALPPRAALYARPRSRLARQAPTAIIITTRHARTRE